jgi:hypothetical protein
MRDYLFVNDGNGFTDRMPAIVAAHDTDHGVQWADYDRDGDLDLALAANDPSASHYLFRNELADASRSIQVTVLDKQGHFTKAGAEVRIFQAGTDRLLGLTIVDTGGGYNAQNAKPVHFGLAEMTKVDIRVTTMSANGPLTTIFTGVDPRTLGGRAFEARVP